jgi:hypothetical protein
VRCRTTCCPVALALPRLRHAPRLLASRSLWLYIQPRCAPRLLGSRLHGLYFNLVMCRRAARLLFVRSHWLSPCVWSLRLAVRLLVIRLHRLYRAYAVHLDLSSRHSTSRRSVALSLAVHPVTVFRGATTHRPDCTGSTAPMPCIRTRRLAAQLLVGRSHCLSPCVRSLRLTARLLIVRIAPALLHLCRASGCVVSPLDFSSISRTGSRRASGHCVSQRDYSSSRLHRLYCTYAVHLDAPSPRSTSCRSVALALVVRTVTTSRGKTTCRPDCTGSTAPISCIRMRRLPTRLLVRRSYWSRRASVTASRGMTTRRPDCTDSTAPMPCIRTRCLDARLLVSRSHWLSHCAQSFRCAS